MGAATDREASAILAREGRSLVLRLRLWAPARYAALVDVAAVEQTSLAGAPATRADLVRHLAQSLADLAAAVEGAPSRVLPRLPSDLSAADQLAVTADDLVRSNPPASVAVAATAHLLTHRFDLLGEAVPPGLAGSLGLDDVLEAGGRACRASAPLP